MFRLSSKWNANLKMGLRYASSTSNCGKSSKCDPNNNIFTMKKVAPATTVAAPITTAPTASHHPTPMIQPQTLTLAPKRSLTTATAIPSITNPENLPHLPLPKLEDTADKYLRTVQPLLSEEKFEKTRRIVEDFVTGKGLHLHNLLQKKAEKNENWLSDWWLKYAYLSYRSPVVIHSNPGLYLPTKFFENEFQWCRYAARVTWASLRYKQMIDYNEIPTEKAGKFPLDMSQYKKIFGTCRIPAREMDKLSYNPRSRHIVVAYRNGFYKVPVYEEGSDKFLDENQLTEQLLLIIRQNDSGSPPVGLLTTEHRDTLAIAYENLIKDPVNQASIDEISKSLFVVCLDQPIENYSPNEDFNIASHQLIHGGGSKCNSGNRWFDKTLQFIVNRNGVNGITYEHSPAEGQPIAVLTDFILKHVKTEPTENEIVNHKSFGAPVKLNFNISNESLRDIEIAAENIDRLSSNLVMNVVHFKSYGKNFIKSQKLSPDSFIQIAMQYAFYKLHKRPAAHYETAQLRMFIHGRTETIRSCSNESVAFAEAMCSPPNTVSDQEKVILLREAVKSHKDYTVMAMSGEGVDRHLFGLKITAIENNIELPELYKDDGFVQSTHFRLSTSQVASSAKSFMCYGPLVENGYGICYNPRNDDIFFAVSAFNSSAETSANEMGKSLTEALENMYRVLTKAGERRLSKL